MDFKKEARVGKSIIFLCLFCIIFFLPQLGNINNIVNRNNDLLVSKSTFTFFKYNVLVNKSIPLWQNFMLSGSPFVSDPQTILFYLPNYLSLLLSLDWFFILSFLLHFILGSVGIFLVFKKLNFNTIASITGSIIYSYSPKFIAHFEAGHLALLASYMWFPYVILGLLILKDTPSIIGSIVLTISLYGVFLNYITIFPFVVLICFIFYGYLVFNKQISKKLLFYSFISVLLFSGLVLPTLVSSLPYFPLTTRNLITFEDIGPRVLSYKHFASSIIYPYIFGFNDLQTESVLYVGLPVILLALIGFFFIKKSFKIPLFFIGLVSIFLALGFKTGFYSYLLNIIPFLSLFRITTRMWFIPIFLVSLISAYFLNRVVKKKWVGVIVLLIIASDFYIFKTRYLLKTQTTAFVSKTTQELYDITTKDDGYYRILCTVGCIPYPIDEYKGLTSGYNPIQLLNYYYFLQKASGYQFASYSPALPPYQTFVDKPQSDSNLLGILGVRYVISPYELLDDGFKLKDIIDGMFVYSNKNEQPRAYGIIENEIYSITPTVDKPGYVELPITDDFETVVLSEVYMPFWKAYDGYGNHVNVNSHNEVVLGVKNIHPPKLTFIFKPKYFTIAVSIWVITLFFILIKTIKIIKERVKL